MANLNVENVELVGVSIAVPKRIVENRDNKNFSEEEIEKFIETTGVERYRYGHHCTSDLCFEAAEKLISELGWDKSEIELLIFVSQTFDYILPNTAPILQDRLGLPKTCISFDMTLGCSGYVYGLSAISSLLNSGKIKKGLLLCGDTPSKIVNPKDKTSAMLFGDAGSATAIQYKNQAKGMNFNLFSDGSGYKAIMIPDGGYRNPLSESSFFENTYEDKVIRNNCNLFLDGMDVFSFGITRPPLAVKELLSNSNISSDEINYFIFHQANLMMNEMIRKKVKITSEKVPYSLRNFGNTSSASIPMTMVSEIKNELRTRQNNLLLCGFGVGLSWGCCLINTSNLIIPDIIEI